MEQLFSSAKKCGNHYSRLEFLWKEYFRDPSQWWDNRNSKLGPTHPDFRHKGTKEPLWAHGWHNPAWVSEELRKREQIAPAEVHQKDTPIFGDDFTPQGTAFCTLLRACTRARDLCRGTRSHADLLKKGLLDKSSRLADTLVIMYVKCNALPDARRLLAALPDRNVFSWTALIAGYAQQGQGDEALNCFEMMQVEGFLPTEVTFACLLKACGSIGAVNKGEQFHEEICKRGLLETNIVLGNSLMDMYVKCSALGKAQAVLEELPTRDVVSWTILIAGYAQQGQAEEALDCFEKLQCEGLSPNAVTFACALKACGILKEANRGGQIHREIARLGLLGKDVVLGSALVDMYAKCGALAEAQGVLEDLPARDGVSWNSLIAGYAEQGQFEEAVNCLERMQGDGFPPSAVTFTCILKACGSVGACDKGEQVLEEIVKKGLLGKDILLDNALVDMFVKCGALAKAQKILEGLPTRDGVSWTSLITGYAQYGRGREALNCFKQMKREGFSPDGVTFACILKACGSLGAIDMGEQIHDEIARQGLLRNDIVLGSALVDMYAKCGVLAKAQQVLEELPLRNVVSWTALIAGYAQQGQSQDALICFEQMQRKGLSPDAFTLCCVLNACSHSGLVDEGQRYFTNMNLKYGIKPDLEHYTCMIDLFGRAGHLDKAREIIQKMPSHGYCVVWHAMLGSCRKWRDVAAGKWAFEHAIQLDKSDGAAYVLMANIYADVGMQEHAETIEAMRVANRAWKKPGQSWWVDKSGDVQPFMVGDTTHAQSKLIYQKLEDLAKKMSQQGYSPGLHWVSQSNSDDAKKDVLCGHSEKLALACALINTSQGETVRIVKNMRICGDCHVATSLISKLESRKIIIRDMNRCHDFEDGKCSCGNYW